MDGFDSAANFGRKTGWWGNIFFIARHFGTGIIISTAFIVSDVAFYYPDVQHLLFHGFVMFQNECVGELSYEATAPAISMAAAMITFILDYVGSRIAHKKYSGHALESPSINDSGESGSVERKGPSEAPHPTHHDAHGHNFDAALAAEQNHQVLLLEAGIIFHSIMIGVTLVCLTHARLARFC
jgi:zinc transporter 1/2/3